MSFPAPLEPPLPKRRKLGFKPPKPSRLLIMLGNGLLPSVLKRGYGIASVRYEPAEIERLRNLKGSVLLTPNHPTHAEPAVMFDLAKRAGSPFYYLSNREAFDHAWGLFGWLLQHCGAYSIVRGAPDRESFKMTRKILSAAPALHRQDNSVAPASSRHARRKSNKLVIFPEGEVYSQNDSLLPFQSGVFQLAFLALEDTQKAGVDASLFIQPVAIRYRFVEDMSQKITDALGHLERHLSLPAPANSSTYERLRRIGDAVLTTAEKAYELPHGNAEDLNPRIDAVRKQIIERVADALYLQPDSLGKTLPDKMRFLMNRLNGIVADDAKIESDYQQRLTLEEAERARPLINDLKRLANWLAVRDGYVGERPTQERMIDTIWRLESEVLGRRMIRGMRECFARLATPFDLREYRGAYQQDRKQAVQAVTERVEGAIQGLLDQMAN